MMSSHTTSLSEPHRSEPAPIEEGNPAEDSRLYRRCLGQYGTGVAIITSELGGKHVGVTVNSFASVSLDPPLLLWSINRRSRSFPAFADCDRFAVNVLSSDQIELAGHFSSKTEEKFADTDWFLGELGLPLLNGCIAHLECEKGPAHHGGDHLILLGRVVHASRYAGSPLLFSQGQYSIPATHPDIPAQPEMIRTTQQRDPESRLISLIFDAHNVLSARFDQHRSAEGMTVAVARVLASIYDFPGINRITLARETYLGQRDMEDAVSELRRKSLLVEDSVGGLTLTAEGQQRREAIGRRWQEFQESQVHGISDEGIAGTVRALKKLIARNSMLTGSG